MSLENSGNCEELHFYEKVIDCYQKYKDDTLRKDICKNKSIVKLFRSLKYKKNKEFVKNSLIFVLSLFDDENNSADLYSNLGKELTTIPEMNLKEIIMILKKEFL